MKPNEIKEIPHVDEDGYFDGTVACMADARGALMLGADCYDIAAPEDDGKHFYKIAADKNGWVAEAIPTTAEECVGIVLDHHKQTERIHKLRTVFDELTKNSTTYRLVQDPETNARSIEKIPEKTVEEVRTEKMRALDAAFMSWYEDGATVVSSLGFEADSDQRAISDVNGLVTAVEAQATLSDSGVIFMDAHNEGHQLTLDQLKLLQLEIIGAGSAAYQEKWKLRDAIEKAKTKEELEKIEIAFHPADFSKAA
ncbi:DUF4376 domain-containing protein [Sutterella faecalis]|uniref:DUF4376 domain-containing protein n=1 Tax=Sutterella faecalis TaxID=2584944 RepID=A0ABX5VJ46_9BURK|nr:DUF4376 domain-containing protein [Sutterella faecalis]QDA55595.1 DUF4376 domain-containing protein [Sutterella faecalis]